jgi:hypothetical protein
MAAPVLTRSVAAAALAVVAVPELILERRELAALAALLAVAGVVVEQLIIQAHRGMAVRVLAVKSGSSLI